MAFRSAVNMFFFFNIYETVLIQARAKNFWEKNILMLRRFLSDCIVKKEKGENVYVSDC